MGSGQCVGVFFFFPFSLTSHSCNDHGYHLAVWEMGISQSLCVSLTLGGFGPHLQLG